MVLNFRPRRPPLGNVTFLDGIGNFHIQSSPFVSRSITPTTRGVAESAEHSPSKLTRLLGVQNEYQHNQGDHVK
jgi:hypothetical protein